MPTPFTQVDLLHPTPQLLVGQSFFITATPVDGDGPYTYEWKKNGVPSGDVANTKTFPSLVETDSGEWTCEVKDANGVSVTPAPVKLEVTPSTTTNPAGPTGHPTGGAPAGGADAANKQLRQVVLIVGSILLGLCILVGAIWYFGFYKPNVKPAPEGKQNDAIVINVTELDAVKGEALVGTIEADGGVAPYSINVTCDGCRFTADSEGAYNWTPGTKGKFTAEVTVTDANGDFNTLDLILNVAEAGTANEPDVKVVAENDTVHVGENIKFNYDAPGATQCFAGTTATEMTDAKGNSGELNMNQNKAGDVKFTVVCDFGGGTKVTKSVTVKVVAVDAPPAGNGNGTGDTGSAPEVPAGDGKAIAEALLGYELPNTPAAYVAGGPGMPEDCAGLCYNFDVPGVAFHYGPNKGEENINQSPEELGDGSKSPIDRMRDGDVTAVIWYNAVDATLELCPVGTLDGVSLTDLVTEATGKNECTNALPVKAGWHVIQDNVGPVAGFTVQYLESGWSNDPSRIRAYEACWSPSGTTATYTCESGDEILVPPSLDSMVKIYQTIDTLIFTTDDAGRVWACNGSLDGMTIEKCDYYPVNAGTHTYVAPNGNRTASVFGWQKSK